jgi:hypothetical protein
MKTFFESGGIAPLDGGEWSASPSCRFTPGEIVPGTHWIGGWVGLGAGLDAVEKNLALPRIEPVACRYTDWAIQMPH